MSNEETTIYEETTCPNCRAVLTTIVCERCGGAYWEDDEGSEQ